MKSAKWLMVVLVLVLCAACAAGPNPMLGMEDATAGFWLGLWHGLIIFFTLIGSLFTDNVSIYEVNNNGGWYDVGFYLGVVMALESSGIAVGRRSSSRE